LCCACWPAQLLGRAKDVREYIKRGERSALVQVTLSSGNPARPTVVSRKISDVDDGPAKNEWKLNGVVVNQTKVAEVVEQLNIQLDNLCQFLPQDRVVEFAAMQPKELLLETEKALGEQELFVQHQQLMTAKADIADLEKSVVMEKERMTRLQEEKGALERDVKKFKQREALLAQADALKEKLPWLLYDAAREKCSESKEHFDEAKNSVRAPCPSSPSAHMPGICCQLTSPPTTAGRQGEGPGGCQRAPQVRGLACMPHLRR
jgi:chromosome segregation ATPase